MSKSKKVLVTPDLVRSIRCPRCKVGVGEFCVYVPGDPTYVEGGLLKKYHGMRKAVYRESVGDVGAVSRMMERNMNKGTSFRRKDESEFVDWVKES